MTHSQPTRKSARRRVPSKKYSTDAFEILDILESDPDAAIEPVPIFDNLEVDKDFESDKAAVEHEEDEESVGTSNGGSDETGVATPVEEFEDALSYTSEPDLLEAGENSKSLGSSLKTSKRVRAGGRTIPEENWHFRGINWNGKTKEAHMKYLVGTNPQDMADFVRARDKWVQLATIPTRVSDVHGSGGMALPFASSDSSRSTQASADWDWYYSQGGKRTMEERQQACSLSLDDSSKYVSLSHRKHSFLMGPYGNQRLHSLASLETLSVKEAWKSTPIPEAHSKKQNATTKERNGWMLNVGAKVTCLDWAPNHPSHIQYLAIATSQNRPPGTQQHSPFEPSESYSTSLQLWAVQATTTSGSDGLMNMTRAPELVQIICTDWGALKQFRWCPAPSEAGNPDEQGKTLVGLLAGVCSDGYVRVLDIQLESAQSSPSVYGKHFFSLPCFILQANEGFTVRYHQAAFESRPPDTVCTCLTWLSATELAVGCANGFVTIWDIAESILSIQTTSTNIGMPQPTFISSSSNAPPRPWFYHYLHHSYILSIVSTYPSHPHFLVSASMDGYLRLTDIRNPAVDFVLSARSRMLNSAVDYHPHIQSFLHSEDNDCLRALPLRRFFTVIMFGKAEGTVLSMAVGKVHPCVLIASADGTVMITNPMRKVMGLKQAQYQQNWFRHEWIPRPQPLQSEGDEGIQGVPISAEHRHVAREGISRITEGYKVETVDLLKSSKAKSRGGTVLATIYEEESAVTQVAWNPNLHCGGWAAAGTGCGLVRIEDLAI
ncbi:hypothetical protein MMC17_007471 [Xylographa soralifera]|nr:hypothetical protein [Xylographa soralifera]